MTGSSAIGWRTPDLTERPTACRVGTKSSWLTTLSTLALSTAGRLPELRPHGGISEMPNSEKGLGIVVGVDGSSSSKSAIRGAAHEARMRNVPLTLVHVVVT